MKKLPKAQLGAIVKGLRAGVSAGKGAYKAAKTIKPKVTPKPKRLTGSTDVTIPAYIATYGGAGLLAAAASGAFNKKPNINSRGTETIVHTGANGKKYVKVTTANDGKTYNKIIEPKKRKGGSVKKYQLGGIIKGAKAISKFFGPAAGATGKSSKIIKPAVKAVKKTNPTPGYGIKDNVKFLGTNIIGGGLIGAGIGAGLTKLVGLDKASIDKAAAKKKKVLKKKP